MLCCLWFDHGFNCVNNFVQKLEKYLNKGTGLIEDPEELNVIPQLFKFNLKVETSQD